jgi:hypothetical protein
MRMLKAILRAIANKDSKESGDSKSTLALPYGSEHLVKCHSILSDGIVSVTVNSLRQSPQVDYVVVGPRTITFMHDLYAGDVINVDVENPDGVTESHKCQL